MAQASSALTDEELQAVSETGDAGLLRRLTPEERTRLDAMQSQMRPSATSRFVSGAWQNLNPMGLVSAVAHPIDTATNLVNAQVDQFSKAKQDYSQGHYSEMVGHGAAGLLPVLGPAAARAGETIAGGDIAGGLGQGAGLLAPFAADAAISGARAGIKSLPEAPAGSMRANAADALDRTAVNKFVEQTGPKVGPNKVRLNAKMADKAPELLREPGLGAMSREGLHAKVADRLAQATDAIDSANDARLASQQVNTAPILQQLDTQIAKLTASPVEGSQIPRPTSGPAAPIGRSVEPAPNAAQIATLRQIKSEVQSLGPVAPYEAVRRIRQAWDQVAKVKYLPSTAADALKAQGEATAAMNATGAMRDALAATDPQSAAAYHQYSLYKAADDVLTATQEAERARPRVGRTIMARATGAVAGGASAGTGGALVGTLVGGIADRAAQLAPTLQILVARKLAAIADLIRGGDLETATNVATRLDASLPRPTQAANGVPRDQASHPSVNLPPEFAPVDAPVATPGAASPSVPRGTRMDELRDKFGGRGR